MLDKIISYSFYILFFLTPLFWTSKNFELFEYNKMILVYGFTIIIVGTWLLKIINRKSLIINRTPLDIPLLLFLAANILSTVFSIDVHTSIWGYYSRSNGGLLSLISYLLLYWAFVSNMDKDGVLKTLKFGLASGILISLWGISEHFGVSPSCVILRGQLNDSCWIQDVQARVFATLGQPNWLAVYLAMLLFPVLYFLLTATKKLTLYTYWVMLAVFYLAFTFTYSRGPTLGLIGGMAVFIDLQLSHLHPKGGIMNFAKTTPLVIVLGGLLFINILFGSALTSFRLVSKFAPPPRPAVALPPTSISQLESGGTESGQIRFIVWQGALKIFKAYPVFGSGLETFAYAYYQFRPAAHNLTSEWDFLYNKAHNEYLNYLSTTGIVGFGTYMLVIITFLWWCLKQIMNRELRIKDQNHNSYVILLAALLASYIAYLIYNFFLFSVVVVAVFFYLFPAMAFIVTGSLKPSKLPSVLDNIQNTLFTLIYRRSLYTKIAKGVTVFLVIYLLFSLSKLWLADTLFNQGEQASDMGNPGRAYNFLASALSLNSGEPFYRSELAYAASAASAALKDTDATLSAQLKDEALVQTNQVLTKNPKNISYLRTAVRTYFELSLVDPAFTQKTLDAIDHAILLAPTDPKLYYNKALIQESMGKKDQAVAALQKALQLKPNYLDAKTQLEEATKSGTRN